MRRRFVALLLLSGGLAVSNGCANARFVEVNKGEGIVAIPSNTNAWPTYYRDKAEKLIRQQCPQGYEIVWEREEVTGQAAHTNSRTEQRGMNIGPIGLGGEERTKSTTNYSDVTEWRIFYRAKGAGPEIVSRAVPMQQPAARTVGPTPCAAAPPGVATPAGYASPVAPPPP
jgi:hypothetical protein